MCVIIFIMSLFQRHRGFLQSLLREANAKRRNVMLDLANKNQLNALGEMVFNVTYPFNRNHSKIKTL